MSEQHSASPMIHCGSHILSHSGLRDLAIGRLRKLAAIPDHVNHTIDTFLQLLDLILDLLDGILGSACAVTHFF